MNDLPSTTAPFGRTASPEEVANSSRGSWLFVGAEDLDALRHCRGTIFTRRGCLQSESLNTPGSELRCVFGFDPSPGQTTRNGFLDIPQFPDEIVRFGLVESLQRAVQEVLQSIATFAPAAYRATPTLVKRPKERSKNGSVSFGKAELAIRHTEAGRSVCPSVCNALGCPRRSRSSESHPSRKGCQSGGNQPCQTDRVINGKLLFNRRRPTGYHSRPIEPGGSTKDPEIFRSDLFPFRI